MPFPAVDRVIYKQNPLDRVICQLRFPTILRIDSDAPIYFQEAMREHYPFYEEKVTVPAQAISGITGVSAENFTKLLQPKKAYEFSSENKKWVVSLTKDFLALTSRDYVRWEEFKLHLEKAVSALIEFYSPNFYSRVGLRYQNVICRSALGLDEEKWNTLLKPHISAELSLPDIQETVLEAGHNIVFELENPTCRVRIQHGLVQRTPNEENCYLIDNDFFTEERTEIDDDVWQLLEYFNSRSSRLFRWCIDDKLHEAMGPEPAQ